MPSFLHLPPLASAIITITGVALAIVRLLTASRPFWASPLLPAWLQKGLPAALVAFGAIPTALDSAKSWTDVLVAAVVAAGTWFTASRGDNRQPLAKDGGPRIQRVNSDPKLSAEERVSMGPLLVLLFLCSLPTLHGCTGHQIAWPKVLNCATPLEQPLIDAVGKVLAGTGDVESELGQLVTSGAAASAVECAVQLIISDLTAEPKVASGDRAVVRGRAFLAKVQK